jgi:methylmalonyl-CoA carboxyltransferase 12S subunit
MQQALKTGTPFVFINDSGGARVQEGIDSLSGLRQGLLHQRHALGRGAADLAHLRALRGRRGLQPALTDFIIQTRQAQMFITGPQVIKQVTGESHARPARRSRRAHGALGVIHFIAEDDRHAICSARSC